MRTNKRLLWLYLVFLVTILAQSGWWLIYMGRQAQYYADYELQRLRTDQIHAAYLLNTSPEIRQDPRGTLGAYFPDLLFRPGAQGTDILIDPEAEAAIRRESSQRRTMFLWEGGFFLVLLLAGASLVFQALRRERSFHRARELFLAGVTHEFKTPLASLSLYADTIARPELVEAERGRILGHMSEDLGRLRLMVEQVLAVSRAGVAGVLSPVTLDPGDLTRRVLADLAALAEREGAAIEADLSEDLRVRADEQALLSALRNVVGNAIHYSPAPARVQVSVRESEGWVRLAVADDGPGIPRREQKRIFQSFYRVGEAGQRPVGIHGTGLGLYLVKRNMEAMGGRVELASEPGAGSVFTLVLPAFKELSS